MAADENTSNRKPFNSFDSIGFQDKTVNFGYYLEKQMHVFLEHCTLYHRLFLTLILVH